MNKKRFEEARRFLGERRFTAYRLRKQEGMRFKDIGAFLGVGPQRAYMLYQDAVHLVDRGRYWTDGLSIRTANCLNNMNLKSRAQVLKAYKSGRLRAKPNGIGYGYGQKTHEEVLRWLGLSVAAEHSNRQQSCGKAKLLLQTTPPSPPPTPPAPQT
jgi:hypothetical protein